MPRHAPLILAITGGSGSGKTSVAEALADALRPRAVAILREDDYYRDNAATPGFDPATFNFDDVATRDHGLLGEHLKALRSGRAIAMPRYDFAGHARLAETVDTGPADIVIVEGIHVLCPAELRALYDYAIYLDIPDDIRLARRIFRDMAERQRSIETVIRQYVQTVRPMHYRFTDPCRAFADRVIAFDDASLTADVSARAENLRRMVDGLADEVLRRLGPAWTRSGIPPGIHD
jgi:uridine kinase